MKQTWRRPGPKHPDAPEHESPRRTTAGTTAAPTQKRAEEGPEGDHPAATMQTSQGGVAASPQVPPAAGHTRADRPWARRSKGPPPLAGAQQSQGARPRQATAEIGPALTRASRPERETTNAPAAGASSTGRAWHHYPQRGNQRQTPELNPLHSGVETGRPPRYPAAAEKTTSPDPDRMASSSSQPPAPDKEQRTGVATRRQRSTTSPASQQHTRTPKPYLYVGVMEREKGSIRDGEEIIGGGKAPPLPQICPGQGAQAHPDRGPGPSRPGPRPIQTGAHGSRGGPPDPTAEEKLPPPHHSVNSQTTEDNRHPG
ncbi:mucin-1-like [Labeo rohita]|uniref:mucin-1-like n=1 Tax=Labeo rohita TaxID=84645 RepID=UPI0021E2E6C6|nr:mucin-1-like [Labeo rohita]